jgi:hypothetical protein
MNTVIEFLSAIFSPLPANTASHARALYERADHARGISSTEAALLRANALAMLRVVR